MSRAKIWIGLGLGAAVGVWLARSFRARRLPDAWERDWSLEVEEITAPGVEYPPRQVSNSRGIQAPRA